jgi:signal transduction histidine kinase
VRPYSYETEATRKNGSRFPVEVQESAIEYGGGMIKASVIRDITKRAEMEKQLLLERQKKLSWVIDGQELERQRLSRELHDGLGQSLIGLKLRIESIPDPEDSATAHTLNDLKKLFDKTIEEIRQISNDLMPAGLNEFGLINALRKLCDNTEMNAGIRVHFKAGAETAHLALSRKTNAYMYRIAQEAMNNTMKHAAASEISVEIFSDSGKLFLNIADNGKGFKFGKTHSYVGNGLYNMRERAGLLGGSFEIFSEPGKGTLVKVNVPVQEKQIQDE